MTMSFVCVLQSWKGVWSIINHILIRHPWINDMSIFSSNLYHNIAFIGLARVITATCHTSVCYQQRNAAAAKWGKENSHDSMVLQEGPESRTNRWRDCKTWWVTTVHGHSHSHMLHSSSYWGQSDGILFLHRNVPHIKTLLISQLCYTMYTLL